MPVFPEIWLGELLSKNDIAGVVSEYVQLKSKGGHNRLWGCCPFHSEKTPSFSVTQDKQLYYCFGCKRGGDVVKFVMEMEKLPYVDAIKFLAQRVGMELPNEVDDEKLRRERAQRERIYAANKAAARFYLDNLFGESGEAPRQYLQKRGLDGKIAKRFGLGFAPEGWENLSNHLTGLGYTKAELISAGLAIQGKSDGVYDAFRNRIVFPIIGANDRVLGFGARTMGNDTPKYLNTGDTPVFNKRANLYAINMQKRKKLANLLLVEGYMDVIGLNKCGVDNAVATLGTSLTTQQARLIKRYAPLVYLCYDGDFAGQNATLRGLDILGAEGLDVKVIVIPQGKDPDEYVRANGADAFNQLKRSALPLNAFKLEHLAHGYDLETADGREAYAKAACALVGTLQPVEQERYIPLIAQKTGIALTAIKDQCGLVKPGAGNSIGKYRNTKIEKNEDRGEKADLGEITLLSCMMVSKQAAAHTFARMAEEELEFSSQRLKKIAEGIMMAYARNETPDIRLICAGFEGMDSELAQALLRAETIAQPERTADDCVKTILRQRLTQQCEELSAQADDLSGAEKTTAIARLIAIQKRLNDINTQ